MIKKISKKIAIGSALLVMAILAGIFLLQSVKNKEAVLENSSAEVESDQNDRELILKAVGDIVNKKSGNMYEKIDVSIEELNGGYSAGSLILRDFDVLSNDKNFKLEEHFIAIYDENARSWQVVYEGGDVFNGKSAFSYESLVSLKKAIDAQSSEKYAIDDFLIMEDNNDFLRIDLYVKHYSNNNYHDIRQQVFANYQNGNWSIIFVGEKIPCSKFVQLGFPEKFKSYSYCGVQTELTSNWEIVSGNPNDNCSRPNYNGEATVSVWYVHNYDYVDKAWLIKISKNDLKKIFKSQSAADRNNTFSLIGMDKGLEERLKKSSESNPVKLTIRGLYFYCEGVVRVSLNPIENQKIN